MCFHGEIWKISSWMLLLSGSSQYDLNNVERDIKHQIHIIILSGAMGLTNH